MKKYDFIEFLAMTATPLAGAILFGWNVFHYLTMETVPVWLAVLGGLGGAIALEAAGIYVGHVGIETLKERSTFAVLPLLGLLVYVLIGWHSVERFGEIFLLALFIYPTVALRTSLQERREMQRTQDRVAQQFERRQQSETLEHQRKMEELRIRLNHEAKMQRNENATTMQRTKPAPNGHKVNKAQLCRKHFQPGMSAQELADKVLELEGVEVNKTTAWRAVQDN